MITKIEKTEFAIASIPYLSKVPIMATFFLQKTYASTCFCQPKEIQRGVSLLGEKAKSDSGAQRLFYKEQVTKAASTPVERVSPPSSFSGPALSISAASRHASTRLWEHLGFTSIYLVHPLVRCVLRSLLPESFHRNTLLSNSRGNLQSTLFSGISVAFDIL